jgi:hypothetical protein
VCQTPTDDALQAGKRDSADNPAHQDHTAARPRRPRSDWVTHPGDLIADCFWLEQGSNKRKILDRDNNTIYPPDIELRYSDWRRRTPADIPLNLQQPASSAEQIDSIGESREPLNPVSQLPTFKSAHHDHSSHRKRSKFKDSLAAADDGGLAKGLKVFMDDSDSSGSSVLSDDDSAGAERGRRRLRKRHRQQDISPMAHPPTPPARPSEANASDGSPANPRRSSKQPSHDHGISKVGRFLKRESHSKATTPNNRSKTRAEHDRHHSINRFPTAEEQPRSSAEYDTTAPNSPVHPTWPSIAINLESPPQSRSPSPAKRHLPAILKPLQRHHKHDAVQTTDFGNLSKRSSITTGGDSKPEVQSSEQSRGTSPMTRGQSPMTKQESSAGNATAPELHGVSRVSTKSTIPSDHSKIRGIFKGGRIAELVGHEVSRVGDFIWKKDPPPGYRRRSSQSDQSGYETDSEVEPMNGTVVKTPGAMLVRSRSSTIESRKSDYSPETNKSSASPRDQPRYNIPNLPSFTSPFDRDREEQQKKLSLLTPDDSHDHISRQAAEHRSASRSPRLDRLAPPRLNTGSRSASPVPADSSADDKLGLALRLTRSQDASEKLNSALHGPGSSSLAAMRSRQSGLDLSQISTRDLDGESPYVHWRDIQRAASFIYSSAVKAKEIVRRCEAPRDKPVHLLQALGGKTSLMQSSFGTVRAKEEHVVAAQLIMSNMSKYSGTFDETLQHFTGTVAPNLHRSLQELEDLIDNKMTPRVRTSADEAGELSIKLASTSTLAIKSVNEAIDAALRQRRRGPVRWIRRAWYASIEYTVVSLLWLIWAIVSLVRGVLAVFSGTMKITRWILWLD